MACSTRGFGAPVTDAGGNVAAHERAEPDVVAQTAPHRAHEVVQPGVRLDRAQRRHVRPSPVCTPARGRCGRGRRSSRSRRGPWRCARSAALVAAVPLIGRVSTSRWRTPQEALGRRRDDRGARAELGELQQRRVGRGVRAGERVVQRDRVDASSHVSRRVRLTW